MQIFNEQTQILFQSLGPGRLMVLSTSYNDRVTSRMMSVIIDNGCFYFQTGSNSRKYGQLTKNPNVSLCTDNIQIEGTCYEAGHPLSNVLFCRQYEEHYKSAYDKYTSLKDERLFKVVPSYIQKWIYEDSRPFIESYDFNNKIYKKINIED